MNNPLPIEIKTPASDTPIWMTAPQLVLQDNGRWTGQVADILIDIWQDPGCTHWNSWVRIEHDEQNGSVKSTPEHASLFLALRNAAEDMARIMEESEEVEVRILFPYSQGQWYE